jgi:AraC-like DNA-binding protein
VPVGYREHPAPSALSPWVECLWEREGDGSAHRVLPDGCIDVVWMAGSGTWIVGPNTTAFLARAERAAGARLHPGAAGALLGVAAEELVDARIPVDEAWPGARAGPLPSLADELELDGEPVAALIRALEGRLPRAELPDPLVRETARRLAVADAPVAALADALAVSERQLRRRVGAAVGYGPKRLARILRLRRALTAAHDGVELARAAAEAGYADQAHFAGECRELAGLPPSRLILG